MPDRFLNLRELRAKLGNRSRSAVYVDMAVGRLPPPIRLGGRLLWREGEIDALMADLRTRAG
jgi:prophage regulatory protein